MNSSLKEITQISAPLLASVVKVWLAAEMAVSARMLAKRLPYKMTKVNVLPYVAESLEMFTEDAWGEFVQVSRRKWKPVRIRGARSRKLRSGHTTVQKDVLAAIRAKIAPRSRLPLCQP